MANGMSVGLERAIKARGQRDVEGIRPEEEHGQFSQGVTEQFGPLGAMGMSVAIPLYQLYKALLQSAPQPIAQHMYQYGATPASVEQAQAGYGGIGRGMMNWLPPRPEEQNVLR